MRRIFIAINLPQEIKNGLVRLQEELSLNLSNIRWTAPDNIHLTLVFLGEIDEARTEKVCQITKEAVKDLEIFSLSLKGLGVFPEVRRPKILWIGVFGDSMLKLLNQSLFRRLSQAGFTLDDRAFTPHITIGRAQDRKLNKEALLFCLNKFKEAEFGKIEIKNIEVMESQLKEGGPRYTVVEKVGLKGN